MHPFTIHPLRRRSIALLASLAFAGLASLTMPTAALAQTPTPFPTVRLMVGYSAGGPVDSAARLVAPALAAALNTQVIVENRPGASGALAGDATVKATPDGSVLFFAASPTITISPHVYKKMSFDPARDLTAIAPVLSYANVLVVNKDVPFKNVAELIVYAKAHPGELNYGSAGNGASNHLSGVLLGMQSHTQLTHIPYKGNAPAMTDVMAGRLAMMFDIVGGARQFILSGRVRALAVTSRERNAALPDVPTMREAGLPNYDVGGWYGIYGPKDMPAPLVARINEATRKALANDALRARLVDLGYDLWVGPPDMLTAQARKDLLLWGTTTQGIEIE